MPKSVGEVTARLGADQGLSQSEAQFSGIH
jgi:hypothetical protein